MHSKLTLLIDNEVITHAKGYAQNHGVSLSKMVEHYFKYISKNNLNTGKVPPITKELIGMADIKTKKSDKELLIQALNKRHS